MAVLLLAMTAINGCRTAGVSTFTTTKKAIRVDRPMFDVFATRLSDTTVQFRFVTTSSLRTVDNSIRYVDLILGTPTEQQDSLLVFPTLARDESDNGSIYVVGEALWESPRLRTLRSVPTDIAVVTTSDHIIFSQDVEIRDPVGLDLYPSIMATTDTSVSFQCLARRVFVPRGEYLPSSEMLRVRVLAENGDVVWRSDEDMAFLTLVSLVQPQTAGRLHVYEMPWNGRTSAGERVRAGTYRAQFIIPARPNEYGAFLDFTWPLR
jgi:hypothetical protein